MATAADTLDREWLSAMRRFERDWNAYVEGMRRDFEQRIAQAEKDNRETRELLDRFEKEHKDNMEAVKKEYLESIARMERELQAKYEEVRRQADAARISMEEARDRYNSDVESLRQFREEVERQADEVVGEFKRAEERLRENFMRTYEKLDDTLKKAREEDPRLDEHSMGQVKALEEELGNLYSRATDDAYYRFSEMLILGRRISMLTWSIRDVLASAKVVREREKAMMRVRDAVRGHIADNPQYAIRHEEQQWPWTPYYIEYNDMTGAVFRVFASDRGFTVDVVQGGMDRYVWQELMDEVEEEFRNLYEDRRFRTERQYNARSDYDNAAASLSQNDLPRRIRSIME